MKLTGDVYLVGSGSAGIGLTHELDCHVYLLDGGGELALVDAGVGLDVEGILRNIEAEGFRPQDVRYILITHAHGDHIGDAVPIAQRTGAKIVAMYDIANYLVEGNEGRGTRRPPPSPRPVRTGTILPTTASGHVRWRWS